MSIPTILIPGIQGTKLLNTNTLDFDTIWSMIQSRYETIYDLLLKQDSRFEVNPKSIIERGDVEDVAYREIVHVLERKTKQPVYIFGYDWRQSSLDTAKRLANFVEYLKEKLSVKKFNFIAHSMGGMVLGSYLKTLQGNYDSIEHVIFAVTPFRGSIQALISLTMGEGGIRYPMFNSSDEFRKIARTFPSVFELCPTYQNAVIFEDGANFNIFNPDHWQSNIGDDDWGMFLNRISHMKAFYDRQNPTMINLREIPLEVRNRFLILMGIGVKTKNKVIVQPESPDGRVKNFFNFDSIDSEGDGDGVVPFESASIYKNDILTLGIKKKWTDFSFHALFLHDGRVQSTITRFLLNQTSEHFNGSPWWTVVDDSVTLIPIE
ncbi:lecithin:cholesterol acyltransferase [Neobacillus bataviensis]|uniref:Lecithin:cholesterol acyltransferase n=1 Tax=Neobacillus bataviensis TaxID=220685 RepID=A0A561CZ93_9BACI|nr:alpha/beta hydrolase [Neobacillus bataviensis]TWD96556.1 lecithin:cholesterol acyltransferase [Neobacillus bataviensis]